MKGPQLQNEIIGGELRINHRENLQVVKLEICLPLFSVYDYCRVTAVPTRFGQSDGISFAIYSSDWTSSDVSYMKLISLQMLFTKDAMEMRLGGGVTTISLPVFVTIIKTAYTVFTILQRFED
ncbi:unnamed protein product [Acanthoscelides obtectus]|uniref:Uncharacterized protein n=1 Tax=Acanthoscelides obtectus TaxID=200917 RepID=A0A9P0LJ73_ACAOB|nr:unnamed protein product [Acanthoscelides obtectus]CAK1625967.1 hypothetical protein AOBTE_LOCUS3506 [Acanthoscelides obtectus]